MRIRSRDNFMRLQNQPYYLGDNVSNHVFACTNHIAQETINENPRGSKDVQVENIMFSLTSSMASSNKSSITCHPARKSTKNQKNAQKNHKNVLLMKIDNL